MLCRLVRITVRSGVSPEEFEFPFVGGRDSVGFGPGVAAKSLTLGRFIPFFQNAKIILQTSFPTKPIGRHRSPKPIGGVVRLSTNIQFRYAIRPRKGWSSSRFARLALREDAFHWNMNSLFIP